MKIIKYIPYKNSLYKWKDLGVDSSTLFGAVSNVWALFYGEDSLEDFFSAYEKGEVAFSSLFPMFAYNGKEVLFYPRPILPFDPEKELTEDIPRTDIKKVKKVNLLSERLFFDLLNSIITRDEIYYTKSLIDKDIVLDGKFAYYKEELPFQGEFYAYIETPHISIDRFHIVQKGAGKLFFTEELSGDNHLGFYFLCNCRGAWEKKLTPIFRLLADEGIGGKRSTGKGLFRDVRIEDKKFPKLTTKGYYVLVSQVFPKKEELKSIYTLSLVKDDGFVYYGKGVSLKKSAIYLLKEGSVTREKIQGILLEEEGRNMKIKRNGKAFLIGSDSK